MEQTFNGSTGGILPAVLESEQGAVPPTMSPIINSTAAQVGLSTNYSMQQRGFTADIVCRFQNLTNETTPDLTLSTGDVGEQLVDMHLNTLCPNSPRVAANATRVLVSPSEMTNGTLNFLALLVCSPRAENYTFIVVGSGAYDWVHTTVCTAAPQLTTVTVEYGATINVSRVMDITPQDIDAPASISGAMNIANMFTAAQALESNAIGTQWMLINSKPGKGSDTTLRIIEQYLKGVFEYSGSVLRACIPGLNVSFPNGLPANMVVPTNGTFRTETFGWTYNNRATQWVLLPGTFLMVTTIILVIVAVSRDPGDVSRNSGLFDPTNPLHLMSAAVAGGLTFRGQERQEHKELRVVLTFIPGRGPALVRADNYKPLHSGSLTPRSPYGDGDAEI
ncbi:hypothetical protein B0H15DRAFT_945703 [Mycena belliarum]|uniref:Uncharacterized protein n=1 Tax=Mycena belliarum TaxID=1033014 RepID=A0AAD6XSQ9_9AGAR|nr:hypothetical protein B0H15DRAFT_945703 [Mycena belliae]